MHTNTVCLAIYRLPKTGCCSISRRESGSQRITGYLDGVSPPAPNARFIIRRRLQRCRFRLSRRTCLHLTYAADRSAISSLLAPWTTTPAPTLLVVCQESPPLVTRGQRRPGFIMVGRSPGPEVLTLQEDTSPSPGAVPVSAYFYHGNAALVVAPLRIARIQVQDHSKH